MYKLLIVDDESLERQALRFFVEHSTLEIDTILECGNGVDAVRLALTEQPHICILDIRMPGLSGLEAMEQIKSVNQKCKIIFSTAYSYFDYAVKALQLGALDFLVKPVKKEAFLRAVNKAVDALDAEQLEQEQRRRAADISYVLEKRILRELVTSKIDEGTLWFLDKRSIAFESTCTCFYGQLSRTLNDEEKLQVSRQLQAELAPTGYQHLLFVHRQSVDLVVFGTATLQQELAASTVRKICEKTLQGFSAFGRLAQGCWVEDIFSLELSYTQARRALNEADAAPAVDRISAPPREEPHARPNEVPAEVQAICAYLQENYAEKITLDEVTRQVGFSKYYGSRLFKQYMGTSIIDYLIQIRLNKAKELLAKEEYSIKQISYMVGYQDPNYFTWSFKKATGISPVKYRYFQNMG